VDSSPKGPAPTTRLSFWMLASSLCMAFSAGLRVLGPRPKHSAQPQTDQAFRVIGWGLLALSLALIVVWLILLNRAWHWRRRQELTALDGP
jgi:hypothetical protein